ncbi:MAG: murein biosynthesis integral membrane protein MurJ [Deltaproteobacteria bacterium]|nr:murein biosynthesis integral membrane protein MurJ [Deltaproteobacteria bacterium]
MNHSQQSRIARNATVLAALTMVSRVAGLVRDFMITHFFGASGLTDVFYMAFTIPNVLRRLVAEGTLTTVVQPAYQRARSEVGEDGALRLYAALQGFVLFAVLLMAAVGMAAAGPIVWAFAAGFAEQPSKFALTVELTRWLFPLVITMGIIGLTMAVLNAHEEYAAPALSPIILNIAMITGTIIGALLLENQVMGIVAGVLVGGVLQVFGQVPALRRHGLLVAPTLGWGEPRVRAALAQFIPGLFSLAVYQINIVILRQLASHMGEGSVSYYYTSDRLMELTNGVFAIAIAQGAFSAMNETAQRGDLEGLKRLWRFTFELANLIAIPAATGLAFLAKPIVAVLFLHGRFGWHDVEQTALNVVCASFGLIFTASVRGTLQVFYALEDRRTPVAVSVVTVLVNLFVGLAVVRAGIGVHGLSFTLAVSSAVQAVLLAALARGRLGALGVRGIVVDAAIKLGLALVACGTAWGVTRLGDWRTGFSATNAAVLFGAISVAVVLYAVGAVQLRLTGADDFARKVSARLRRRRP